MRMTYNLEIQILWFSFSPKVTGKLSAKQAMQNVFLTHNFFPERFILESEYSLK